MDRARMALDAFALGWEIARHTFWGVIEWAQTHEEQFDLYATWIIVGCLLMLAWDKRATLAVISRQRDRTSVGRAMKPQKASEMVIFLTFAMLYGAGLLLYYEVIDRFDFWGRMALRAVLVTAMVAGAFFGRRFRRALDYEVNRPPAIEDEPRATGLP